MSWDINKTVEDQYLQQCWLAASNSDFFFNFKRNPVLNQIWEHVSREGGQVYLDHIKKITEKRLHSPHGNFQGTEGIPGQTCK